MRHGESHYSYGHPFLNNGRKEDCLKISENVLSISFSLYDRIIDDVKIDEKAAEFVWMALWAV